MENKNDFLKNDIKKKLMCAFILITHWELMTLMLEIFYQMKKKKKNLIYDISYKTTFMSSIPLRISFDKIDGLLKSMINQIFSIIELFL